MAKLDTIFSAMIWGLMNALLIAVACDTAFPAERVQATPTAELAGVVPPPMT